MKKSYERFKKLGAYFERAVTEVDEMFPPALLPMKKEDVRTLMILAWLRGASWRSHGTH
jgi:hypothetical protein